MRYDTRSTFILAMLGLTAAACLTLPASVQGQLLDDFSDCNDDGWTRFTDPWGLPGAAWDASSGVYRLSAVGFPGGAAVLSQLDSTADPHFSNGYLWATVVRESENSWTNLLMRGDMESQNAYQFACHPDLGLFIAIIENSEHTVLATDPNTVQAVGGVYIMEAGAIGSDLELRLWPLGDPRPKDPQVSYTDSTFPSGTSGVAAAAVADGDLSVTFDDVCFMWRDEFNDGDDDGWTRFTIPAGLPGANWNASTGVYRLSVDESAPQGGAVASFLGLSNDPSFWNGYWWATVVRETENSTSHVFMRGEFATMNAYGFGWQPDTGLTIQRIAGGAGTVLDSDDTFVQEVGTEYILEAGSFGPDLELRMWAPAEDRPELPQVAATDSTYTWGANGIVAQAYSDGDLSATFDDVSFVPEPLPGDLDGDGDVDLSDLGGLLAAYGTCEGDPAYNPDADLDDSGCVDLTDLAELLAHYGYGA
jgi:hypothetical protein